MLMTMQRSVNVDKELVTSSNMEDVTSIASDSWEYIDYITLNEKQREQREQREQRPKCCHHQNPQPCCERNFLLFEENFTCNKNLSTQLADVMKKNRRITSVSITLTRFNQQKKMEINYNMQYKLSGYISECDQFYNLSRDHANVYRWLYYAKKRRWSFESLIRMRNYDYTHIILDFLGPDKVDIINKPIKLARKLIDESKDKKIVDKIKNTRSAILENGIRCKQIGQKPKYQITQKPRYDCDFISSSNGKMYGINIRPYDCYGCPKSHHDVERGYDYYFHLYNNKPIINMYGNKVKFCIKIIENIDYDDFYDEICWDKCKFDCNIHIILTFLMCKL